MRVSSLLLVALAALICLSLCTESVSAHRTSAAEKVAKYNARVGAKFLAEKAKEEGVVSLPSGVLYKVLQSGSGTVSPSLSDKVRVHYAGTLINGKEFDSSYARGSPAEFGVSGVIQGSDTRAQRQTEGEGEGAVREGGQGGLCGGAKGRGGIDDNVAAVGWIGGWMIQAQ